MKHIASLVIASCTMLTACGGGGVVKAPVPVETVRDMVQNTFGFVCEDINGTSSLRCDESEEDLHAYSPVSIQVFEEDDGQLDMSLVGITYTEIDRKKVLKLVKRFGFGEKEFNMVTQQGQRLTIGDFTAYMVGRQEIVIARK